jgi:phage shock protein PspC (stress-responsive transcriptional regulator)
MQKKLYKSKTDRKISGVCGGVSAYLGIDSTVVRLIWILLVFAGCSGLIAYIVCALIMPEEPDEIIYSDYDKN